jgi:hypothetical protein
MNARLFVICLAALGVGPGCSNGGEAAVPLVSLPSVFKLEASAETVSGMQTVECGLDFIVELTDEVSRSNRVVEYLGTMGGEARRSILDPDGSGHAFIADSFSEVQVSHRLPDGVEIRSINVPPNPPGVSSRFWDELLQFDGRLGPGDMISGDWICAPLDTDLGDFADDSIFAPGTWFTLTL